MGKTVEITAIVLTADDALALDECLGGLHWVDEIVIVDNGQMHAVTAVARKHGAFIYQRNTRDFSVLRTFGKEKARGTWVLYIDVDETVPEALRKEISETISSFSPSSPRGYFLKRDTYFLNHRWPAMDAMQRLFYRSALRGWHGSLHETADVDGVQATLKHPLIHRTHRTLEEMAEKTNEWSRIEARLRHEAHHPQISWWRFLRVMCTGFSDSFVRKGGWRAGTIGWIESVYQAFSMFITYAKLWEMQENTGK